MAGFHFGPGDRFKLVGFKLEIHERWDGSKWVRVEGTSMYTGKSLQEEDVVIEIVKFMQNYTEVHIRWVETGAELIVDWSSFLDNTDPITL